MSAARSEVADLQTRDAVQSFHFLPEFGFSPRVENIELEFAKTLEAGARPQFADGRKSINFPHRRLGPQPVKTEGDLPVFDGQLIIREPEVTFEPLEEGWFKDSAAAVEGIASEPDQFGLMKSQLPCLLELFPKLVNVDQIPQAYLARAIHESKRSVGLRELLPDKLQHQQFVKIVIEQRPRNRVQFPIVVMCTPGQVNDHIECYHFTSAGIHSVQTHLRDHGERRIRRREIPRRSGPRNDGSELGS